MKLTLSFLMLFLTSFPVLAQNDSNAVEDGEEPFLFTEVMPEFPGGDENMHNFIVKNMRYPPEAIEKNIQGKVIVRFIVEKNGKVSHIECRTGDPLLQEEAVRIVKLFPAFKPGRLNGKPVRVIYTVPIRFVLK